MELQNKEHIYICVPDHPDAVKRFEQLMEEWAIDLNEDLMGYPMLYPDIVYEDVFCQRDLFDFQTEVAVFNNYGKGQFPVDLDQLTERGYNTVGDLTFRIEAEFRVDMMLFLNRRYIFYGLGTKNEKTEKIEPLTYYNPPVKEIW